MIPDGTPYQPSNGTEGMGFYECFCDQCIRDEEYRETMENGCPIFANTMVYDVKDPEYPKEWIYRNGQPTCTAFEKIVPNAISRRGKTDGVLPGMEVKQ